jgi:hypothetical protein
MTSYEYTGPVTAFTLNDETVTLVPHQNISLDETDDYVIRLVERGHLVAVEGV